MFLTDRLHLRGGRACWQEREPDAASDLLPDTCDVVVIGAGVMGAMIADSLSTAGIAVTVIDRRSPVTGATAGSTALVMWGADIPLRHLTRHVGEEGAAKRWRRVYEAVEQLDAKIKDRNIECGWRDRPELYLAGDLLDSAALESEGRARRAAGLPSEFLDKEVVHDRFRIDARPALISAGSYEVDPVELAAGLFAAARARGARLCFPVDVERLEAGDGRVRVWSRDGESIEARHVVLATGYEAARMFLPAHFSLSSSYAIASKPRQAPAWSENALIWEASDPYLYARATTDGRILVGGEDEDLLDPDKRDALIPEKRAALEAKAAVLLRRCDIEFECAWASTFGASPDGLPAIGPARNFDNLLLAYGFGGNGVTFASLGADLIKEYVFGKVDPAAAWFDPYRSMPKEEET